MVWTRSSDTSPWRNSLIATETLHKENCKKNGNNNFKYFFLFFRYVMGLSWTRISVARLPAPSDRMMLHYMYHIIHTVNLGSRSNQWVWHILVRWVLRPILDLWTRCDAGICWEKKRDTDVSRSQRHTTNICPVVFDDDESVFPHGSIMSSDLSVGWRRLYL